MSNELGRVLVYSDLHLSSKNYGAHNDYPKDSLETLGLILNEARKFQPTHIIGLGDLTYGRFQSLDFRFQVERVFSELYDICNGRHYQLKGNHDTAGYGMTEYEYYIQKGTMKPAENFTIGNCHFTLVNYHDFKAPVNFGPKAEDVNILCMHDFFKFADTDLPNYGEPYILDNFTQWFGVNYIIGGHIHTSTLFSGYITNLDQQSGQTFASEVLVDYPGALSRPSYREGHMDTIGHIVEITVYDDGSVKYDRLDIPLKPIEEVFNLSKKEADKEKASSKQAHVDISDIVTNLDRHNRNLGNPEDIIEHLDGVKEEYKQKAIELLKLGMA